MLSAVVLIEQASGVVIDSTFHRTVPRNPNDPTAGTTEVEIPSELDLRKGHVLHGWAAGIPGM